jgi:hypothetical protein
MTTTASPAAVVPVAPVFTNTERLALAGFLAGYSGLARQVYELDLRQYASWCHQQYPGRAARQQRADLRTLTRRSASLIVGLIHLPGRTLWARVRTDGQESDTPLGELHAGAC